MPIPNSPFTPTNSSRADAQPVLVAPAVARTSRPRSSSHSERGSAIIPDPGRETVRVFQRNLDGPPFLAYFDRMSVHSREIRHTFCGWRMLSVTVPLACVVAIAASAQSVPRSDRKATSLVVVRHEILVSNGALLTPEGWKKAAALYESGAPYPAYGSIFLKSTGGVLGETWRQGDSAEVQTKWTDALGTIDSNLKYNPPHNACGSIFVFSLVLKNRQWKLNGRLHQRMATREQALRYVTEMRDRTGDPAIKRNADKTIIILKRLQSPSGNAC